METKKFDAVQFMRQVRDKMSADMRGMSFEEQRAYIEQHASKVRRDLEARQSEGGRPEPRPRQVPPIPPR
jgi:hypothetical protein